MRNIMFMFLLVFFGAGLSAQNATETKSPVGNEPLLQQISSVKNLSDKVNAAYDKVKASAASSRAAGIQAHVEFNDACTAYTAELQRQLDNCKNNTTLHDALVREMEQVKKLKEANP
jgi:hypothetical protein